MNRELLKQALDQLKRTRWASNCEAGYSSDPVIATLEAELDKPEQEPIKFLANGVRYKVTHQGYYGCSIVGLPENLNGQWVALVEATDSKHLNSIPPKELSKPEQGEVVVTKNPDGQIVAVTRQDEDGRILKVIDTSAKPEQAPVAQIRVKRGHWIETPRSIKVKSLPDGLHDLYTAPPRKPWVKITELQIAHALEKANLPPLFSHRAAARAGIEAFKELNGWAQ